MTVPTTTHSRDAVLTDDELADALRISVEKLLKADLPHVMFGRDRRYLYGQILDELASRAKEAA